jgi:hypothetical protein
MAHNELGHFSGGGGLAGVSQLKGTVLRYLISKVVAEDVRKPFQYGITRTDLGSG